MKAAQTPMMKQWMEAKSAHPDRLLLFRLGDFYEAFYEDAEIIASTLELTLTSRNKKDGDNAIPMAGVPYHAANGYIRRLLEQGHSVAICEQLEDPASAKGIVRRGVTRVITPGTQLDEEGLEADKNNFIAAIVEGELERDTPWALALVDASTGELRATELRALDSLIAELRRVQPVEILLVEGAREPVAAKLNLGRDALVVRPEDELDIEALLSGQRVSNIAIDERSQKALTLTGPQLRARIGDVATSGFQDIDALSSALSLVFNYLLDTQGGVPAILSSPQWYHTESFVRLDPATSDNLELFETLRGAKREGSLLSVLDKTVSSAGARRLRSWLTYPLLDVPSIERRQAAVSELVSHPTLRPELRKIYRGASDIQRLCARIVAGQISARDLVALRSALERIPPLRELLADSTSDALRLLNAELDPCTAVTSDIAATLVDDPPITLAEGGLIRKGVDPELDRLIELTTDGKSWLLRYEAEQKEQTGIPTLKVRYNRVFGYYIEVTRANLDAVPDHYIRKQTLANSERYFTTELKEFEEDIVSAQDKRGALELRLFSELRDRISTHIDAMRETASRLAELDALLSLAEVAASLGWVAPEFIEDTAVYIEEGRHPVVEQYIEGGRFVPNDVSLSEHARLLLITGPNMAGKSTVIRQTALLVLLAQIGSLVPAKRMRLGVVDQIFSRVGASDNLAKGQSTFMVEMTETALILKSATAKSLVILDEIGRGTSTWDGLAIAWAVSEQLHDHIGCLTLFATHYHELTALADTRAAVQNLSVAVREWQGDIVFLHRLVEGAAGRSYGLEVARLAGIPEAVVLRGREVLKDLEARAEQSAITAKIASPKAPTGQLSLFSEPVLDPELVELVGALDNLDPNGMTPIQALQQLAELVERAAQLKGKLKL